MKPLPDSTRHTAKWRGRVLACLPWAVLAGICGFFFFYGLASFGLVGADEPRYAQIAREMLGRRDWITPTLGGKAWLEKPILYYWETMLAYAVFGVSDWAARVPAAANATLMVAGVYLFLRRLPSLSGDLRTLSFDGAAMTATSAGVVGFARAASMDMLLAAMFTLGMLAWYAWYETRSRWLLTLFYVFLGLGTLAKGPVAVFLALAVIAAFALLRRSPRALTEMLWAPAVAAFSVLTLPWYIEVERRNPEFFRVFVLEHNLARFSTNLYHHQEPFWYYLPVILLALLPWVVPVVAAVGAWAGGAWAGARAGDSAGERGREERAEPGFPSPAFSTFLLLWLVLPVLFFSLSQSKLPGYVVPALPAATLLLAHYVHGKAGLARPLPLVEIFAHCLSIALMFLAACLLPSVLRQGRLVWMTGDGVPVRVALLLAAVLALLFRRFGFRGLRTLTLVPSVVTLALALKTGAPLLNRSLSVRPAFEAMRALQPSRPNAGDLPVAVLRLSREAEYGLGFYTNQTIARYELGEVPRGEHLLVAPEALRAGVIRRTAGRRVRYLGAFYPEGWDFYWVSAENGPGAG
jgi:4-amino-4-deoxy-L-arabinose transferase-like glycosyltransferase